MSKLQKYLFELSFDAPEEKVEAGLRLDGQMLDEPIEELPPPPTYSEEELTLARDQAFEGGRQAGFQEAEASTERRMATALEALAAQLAVIKAAQDEANDLMMKDAVTVAVAVMRKLAPEWIRRNGLDEIENVVQQCLAQIDKDIRVTIRTNPLECDAVRDRAQRVALETSFDGKLIFSPDSRVNPGDCRLDWGDGGAERDQARIWAEIDAIVARALGGPGEAATATA